MPPSPGLWLKPAASRPWMTRLTHGQWQGSPAAAAEFSTPGAHLSLRWVLHLDIGKLPYPNDQLCPAEQDASRLVHACRSCRVSAPASVPRRPRAAAAAAACNVAYPAAWAAHRAAQINVDSASCASLSTWHCKGRHRFVCTLRFVLISCVRLTCCACASCASNVRTKRQHRVETALSLNPRINGCSHSSPDSQRG
jgi:hypothetical protein